MQTITIKNRLYSISVVYILLHLIQFPFLLSQAQSCKLAVAEAMEDLEKADVKIIVDNHLDMLGFAGQLC